MPRILAALVAAALLAVAAAPASAADPVCSRYASPTGSDTAVGSAAFPYRTVQKLADATPVGGVGCLSSGTYTDGGKMYVARITRDDLVLRTTPGQTRATIKGTFYVVNGADRVTVSDVNLDGRPTTGVAPSPQIMAADTILERVDVTNPTDICAILGNLNGYGRALRTIVRDSTFHACGSDTQLDHAIYLEGVNNADVARNYFTGAAAYAIHLYPDADNNQVHDNVMNGNGGGVIFAGQGGLASSGNIVERNVIVNSKHKPGIERYWSGTVGTGNVARGNCLDNNPAGDIVGAGSGFTATGNTFGPCSPGPVPTPTPTGTPAVTVTATATPTPTGTPGCK